MVEENEHALQETKRKVEEDMFLRRKDSDTKFLLWLKVEEFMIGVEDLLLKIMDFVDKIVKNCCYIILNGLTLNQPYEEKNHKVSYGWSKLQLQ